ncbi:hypothetical protein UFOVP143_11 [uncultured Caudovirales phage]|uniref:Uncharacterized protein n=1 Tax=uncultured Caudovirales phage TaxID=2100421 RepID=A0A6J7VN81_9CAUD|nr:hypothetical protein UFOVP143_11 [uncultured Caudovirales phage]
MRWGWLIGAVLLGVAGLSVYVAFQSPAFMAGLTALATAAAWKAVRPIVVKQLTPEDLAAKNQAERSGNGDNWIRRRLGSLRDR